ncbi:MAG: hypothetical protein ACD_12C00637G0005 [uncultured bacterium]|nr:MAG: hypothetical protein ACD_12C00637G0005 [uncultured bacterium]
MENLKKFLFPVVGLIVFAVVILIADVDNAPLLKALASFIGYVFVIVLLLCVIWAAIIIVYALIRITRTKKMTKN